MGCTATPRSSAKECCSAQQNFLVHAPPGWILDDEAGKEQGLLAVFYPHDSSWSEAGEVLYVNTVAKEPDQTLADVMLIDLARQREESPGVQMHPAAPLPIADGTLVPVNDFSGDTWGNLESVAYADGGDVWVMIVLTARTTEGYTRAHSAFAQLVHSYETTFTRSRGDRTSRLRVRSTSRAS